jgi:hypothetical protein
MGPIEEAAVIAGKIVTFALAEVLAGESRTVVSKCKMPRVDKFVSAL